MTRVTIAEAAPFDGEKAATAWLERTLNDGKALNEAARDAVELINVALGALREAADDPLIGDVGVGNALVVRIGFGAGEELADGHWTEARQLPSPGPRRHEQLDPQRQVANRLAGRSDDDQGEDD